MGELTFREPDEVRFPGHAARHGGGGAMPVECRERGGSARFPGRAHSVSPGLPRWLSRCRPITPAARHAGRSAGGGCRGGRGPKPCWAAMGAPPIWMTLLGFALLLAGLIISTSWGTICPDAGAGLMSTSRLASGARSGADGRHGTRWRIAAIPLGGYVQFAGDMNPADAGRHFGAFGSGARRQFRARPVEARGGGAGGPLANLLVALAILPGSHGLWRRIVASVVGGFAAHSNAEAAGLQLGDRIVAIGGAAITRFDRRSARKLRLSGTNVQVAVERAGGARHSVALPIASVERTDEFGHIARRADGIAAGTISVERAGPLEAVRLAGETVLGERADHGRWRAPDRVRQAVGSDELGGPVKIAANCRANSSVWGCWPRLFVASSRLIWHSLTCCQFRRSTAGTIFYAAERCGANHLMRAVRNGVPHWAWRWCWPSWFFVTLNDLVHRCSSGDSWGCLAAGCRAAGCKMGGGGIGQRLCRIRTVRLRAGAAISILAAAVPAGVSPPVEDGRIYG